MRFLSFLLSQSRCFPINSLILTSATFSSFAAFVPKRVFGSVFLTVRAVCFILITISGTVDMMFLICNFQMSWINTFFVFTNVMQELVFSQCYLIGHFVTNTMGTSLLAVYGKSSVAINVKAVYPNPASTLINNETGIKSFPCFVIHTQVVPKFFIERH